ncbi:MAG: CHAT domain-containing protein [Nitrospirae bacterium]|nr:CHAT domain-containing protein [Nitrospirota bacterium]
MEKIYFPETLCIIGVTEKGIYTNDSLWYNYARLKAGIGVVSTYLLERGLLGKTPYNKLLGYLPRAFLLRFHSLFGKVNYNKLLERVLKKTNRIIYYSLNMSMENCSNPNCASKKTVSLAAIDSSDLDFCDEPQKKLLDPVWVYGRMAYRYQKLGFYSDAEKYFKKALAINPSDIFSLDKLGNLYHYSVNNEEQAEVYYLRAIAAFEKLGDKKKLAGLYNSLGWVYHSDQINRGKRGYMDRAFVSFQKALALSKETGNEWQEQRALSGLAAVYDKRINFEKSIELKRKSMEICKRNGWTSTYMSRVSSLAVNYGHHGKYDKALEYVAEGMPYWKEKKNLNMIAWSYGIFGRAYLAQGKHEEAYQALKKSVEIMEKIRLRNKLDTDKYKRDFMGYQWKERYNWMIEASLTTNREAEAFNTIQMYKARALLDLLGGKKFNAKRKLLTEKEKEKRLLLAKIDTLKGKIDQERQILGPGGITRVERTLKLEQSKYEKLKEDIANSRQEIKSLENISPSGLKDVQKFIKNFTLVEYFVATSMKKNLKVFACIITKDNFTIQKINISQEKLKEKITQFREAILQTSKSQRTLKLEEVKGRKPKISQEKELSQELYNLLIKPVRPYIKTKIIYISPDNVLNYLPFQALQNKGRYLVEDYAIAYTPSASVLKFFLKNRRQNNNKERILAFGNANLRDPRFKLVYAEKEVKKIARLFPQSRVFLGDEANEYTVKLLSGDYDILHFAIHGQLNPEEPMLSCLRLSPDKENDGYLHVREIFDLNLNASLVVLSACDTALGELTLGNEVVGLTRAFLFAGASSVISTLWNIDDEETSILMTDFYKNLKTMSKVEALREAQVAMIKRAKAPYYWAAFGLFGDYR